MSVIPEPSQVSEPVPEVSADGEVPSEDDAPHQQQRKIGKEGIRRSNSMYAKPRLHWGHHFSELFQDRGYRAPLRRFRRYCPPQSSGIYHPYGGSFDIWLTKAVVLLSSYWSWQAAVHSSW